jgi:hypothetical protein
MHDVLAITDQPFLKPFRDVAQEVSVMSIRKLIVNESAHRDVFREYLPHSGRKVVRTLAWFLAIVLGDQSAEARARIY